MYELNCEDYISVVNTETGEEVVHIEYDADMNDVICNIENLVMCLNDSNS